MISFILLISVFSFSGCSNSDKSELPSSKNLPDFADCKIGYKLEVYPKVAFDYELPDGTIIHIDSIEATLTAKNEIKEGDVIKEPFYPYEVTIKITGNTDAKLAGKGVYSLLVSMHRNQGTISGKIDYSGKFMLENTLQFIGNDVLFFNTFSLSF